MVMGVLVKKAVIIKHRLWTRYGPSSLNRGLRYKQVFVDEEKLIQGNLVCTNRAQDLDSRSCFKCGLCRVLKKKFTDCVYIENVDEGVLTLSAFSVKVSVKRPFSEDFICQLLLSSRPLVGKVILSVPVYHNLLTNINH